MAPQTTQTSSYALDSSRARACAPSSCQKPSTGVYIPPDFEPVYRPNIYTPSDAPSEPLRIDTSQISAYATLRDSLSLLTSALVGEQTESFATGAGRNRFARTFQPSAGEEQYGESTIILRDVYGSRSGLKEISSFRGPDIVPQLPDSMQFRGPAVALQPSPEFGEIDDTYRCDTDSFIRNARPQEEACLDCRQPSWPPKFANQGRAQAQALSLIHI